MFTVSSIIKRKLHPVLKVNELSTLKNFFLNIITYSTYINIEWNELLPKKGAIFLMLLKLFCLTGYQNFYVIYLTFFDKCYYVKIPFHRLNFILNRDLKNESSFIWYFQELLITSRRHVKVVFLNRIQELSISSNRHEKTCFSQTPSTEGPDGLLL